MKKGLHIFRRDLRLEDNTAIHNALLECDSLSFCFFFDPRQIKSKNHNAIQCMLQSLEEIYEELKQKGSKLYLFYGEVEKEIPKLKDSVDTIYFNIDYTPFSKQRDAAIKKTASENNITCKTFHDALLQVPEKYLKADKTPYTVFTPFFNNGKKITVQKPAYLTKKDTEKFGTIQTNIQEITISELKEKINFKENTNIFRQGGRKEALTLLKNIKDHENYKEDRDFPALQKTTGLSTHNKFGTVSVRECYWTLFTELGGTHELIRQYYWRDFFYTIAHFFPEVFTQNFQKKYRHITWENNEEYFKAWCEGNTGFPIVDAGMRELNTTGYMHNRVRMIVASFLTKDLLIDWKWGDTYFAEKLIDYDPCVNNGSWQWAASTGCDAQPYFRIFNPWLQQKRFDIDCKYIKKWIPELQYIENKQIHEEDGDRGNMYPKPLVNHQSQKPKALAMFKDIASSKN